MFGKAIVLKMSGFVFFYLLFIIFIFIFVVSNLNQNIKLHRGASFTLSSLSGLLEAGKSFFYLF